MSTPTYTQEQVEQMARELWEKWDEGQLKGQGKAWKNVGSHVLSLLASEREACAKICDDMHAREDDNCAEAAAAIRARKGVV